ncbi:MAG TPA: cation diffusion facilitator family transporter [Gemmatimonadaceae bacterium]|nr:cation diffusion facilitator family transporter [Gemmatimonadaceae bacterium]
MAEKRPVSSVTPPGVRLANDRRGVRTAQLGLLANAALAVTKLVAGIVGHAYALVADAVESTADVFASIVVWGGLRVASRDPDEAYPFGYGKAEPLAAATVSLTLLGAAIGIAIQAVREIRTPHHAPASWTLVVLVGAFLIKALLFRKVASVANALGSTAVKADAWHHASDAITSAAAFIGISIALIGGPGWESADDWAALFASCVIFYNGVGLLRAPLAELMDRAPGTDILEPVAQAARATAGVRAIEKVNVRRAGAGYFVDLHVQTDPAMSLRDAHVLSGMVKGAIRSAVPAVLGVLVHMEPYEGDRPEHQRRTPGGTISVGRSGTVSG